jgi:ferredoxin
MYCTAGAFSRLDPVAPGSYFALNLDSCDGCGKCIELCPCGFLSAVTMAADP